MKKCVWLALMAGLAIVTAMALAGNVFAQTKPIKIGVLGPMTHVSGKHIVNGVSMARDEINQAGGVNVGGQKVPIELIQVDTNELQSVTDAVSAVERAITVDKVDFLVGSWRSEAVMGEQDVAMDYKKIMISEGSAISVAKRVKDNYNRYKYWFCAYYNSDDMAKIFFVTLPLFKDLIKKELGIDRPKVAIVLDKAAWADPMVTEGPKTIERLGFELVGLWRPSVVATDVSAELLAMKNKGAHIIWVVSWGPVGLTLSKQWADYKIPAVLTGTIGEAGYSTFWKSTNGTANTISTYAVIARVKITDKTIPFWDKYVKATGEHPNIFSAYFYDNTHRLKQAIENAGSLDPDRIVPALEKLVYVGAAGTYASASMDMPGPHDVPMGPDGLLGVAIQWQEGKYKVIWPPADGSYEGLKYEGVVPVQLPPAMVEHWKKN